MRARNDMVRTPQVTTDVDVTMPDGRKFSVVRGGRRWTKVPEYPYAGPSRTATFFVDESTGEVRGALSWKSPRPDALRGADAEYVLAIIARADA